MRADEGRPNTKTIDFSDPCASDMPNLNEYADANDNSIYVDEDKMALNSTPGLILPEVTSFSHQH